MNKSQAIMAIVVMCVITAALRFMPFILLRNRKTPKVVTYLGEVLPYAIMGMLVVYCLSGTSFTTIGGFGPQIIAGTVIVLTYIWKRNTLFSIIGGTACYMLLVQMIL